MLYYFRKYPVSLIIVAIMSLIVALLLKKADKKYGYKLEEPNIQK